MLYACLEKQLPLLLIVPIIILGGAEYLGNKEKLSKISE